MIYEYHDMISAWSRFRLHKNSHQIDDCVRQVVAHACRNVAFYRLAFAKAGVRPDAVRGVSDLAAVPVTTRFDLMSSGPDAYLRRGADPDKLTIKHTTGTTGTPVTVHMNHTEQSYRKITLLRAISRRVRLTWPFVIVDVGPEQKDQATDTLRRIGPLSIIRLFRSMPMEEQIERLLSSRPAIIKGRPSTLWQLALALREQDIRPPQPKMIFTGAEMLFDPVRRLLEDVFRCPVADYYNCEEVGNLAWQCPFHQDQLHLNTSTGWLEAVNQDGHPVPSGQEGHLVVTNLYNHTMPFIRYKLGDRGVLLGKQKCACGVTGPVMRLTEGRDENFIVLPDGREITPRLMYDVVNAVFPHDRPGWKMMDCLRTFQIIQEEEDLIVVKIVRGPAYTDDIWPAVRRNLTALHPALRLEVCSVPDLSPAPGKKFKQVLGKLNTRWSREIKEAGL